MKLEYSYKLFYFPVAKILQKFWTFDPVIIFIGTHVGDRAARGAAEK